METKLLVYIIFVNIIIGLVYFFVLLKKKDSTKAFLMLLFIVLCPVIAILFLLISWLMIKLIYQKGVDVGDLSFNTEKHEMITSPDFDKEINTVPVEEALIVSDSKIKRRVILDVLKEDFNKSITAITNALESDDSEISHYAATVITDVKSNFKVSVQRMREKLEKFPNDPEISCLMADYIHNFLLKKVLSEIEEMTYIEQYEKLMSNLYIYEKKAITSTMYKNVIYHLLPIGKNNEALLWGERALEEHPNELDTYKGILKLYFEIGERNKFFEALTKLKKSNIEFDSECIDLIRFYLL